MPRILVADDNTNIQKMVVLAFQERGIEVIAVGNGEAAVRRIPDANPDLVLADVFMPVRNGYEVCEFVKKDTRYSHIPVILLVGAFDPLDEKEARRVGADGVLKKPFVPPDPLIAMVMSALEKNPKVVAELARAKEAKEAAAAITSLPAAAMENPAMAEVKPLPEFPEPSPEEAAMIYGFGKGVRAIDADESEEDDEEETRSKKSKSAKGLKDPQESQKKSKTPVAATPKTPVVAMEEEDEEVFDSSATASDWRRNAADLEVPDNLEANPIYSYGKNFEPITFPSERDVPPKHVRSEEESPASGQVAETANASAAATEAQATNADTSGWELTTEAEAETQEIETSSVSTAAAPAAEAVGEISSSPVADDHVNEVRTIEAETPVVAAGVSEPEKAATEAEPHEAARPSFVTRVRGWMDMMSPSSDESAEETTETRDQHWMTSLASPPAVSSEPVEIQTSDISAPQRVTDVENPVQLAEAEALAENAAPPAAVETAEAVPNETPVHEYHAEATREEQAGPLAKLEDSPSEPSQFSTTELASSSYGSESLSAGDEQQEAEAIASDQASPQALVHEESRASAAEDAAQVTIEPQSEPWRESTQESWTDRLPVTEAAQHEDITVAEHLPLEPLISELHEQPVAAESEQEPEHVSEWLRNRTNQSELHTDAISAPVNSLPEPDVNTWSRHHAEAASDEKPFADQPEPSIFDREQAQAFTEEFVERIPTLPPPNREALSQIPFLMPRPEPEPIVSDGANASNSAAVDEVVRRVLEKLQPQLHELLSQGVKPLVENMLQNELNNELHKNQK